MKSLVELARYVGKDVRYLLRGAKVPQDRAAQLVGGAIPTIEELKRVANFIGLSLRDLGDVSLEESDDDVQLMLRTPYVNAASEVLNPLAEAKLARHVHDALSVYRLMGTWPTEPDDWLQLRRECNGKSPQACARAVRVALLDDDQLSPATRLPMLVAEKLGVHAYAMKLRGIEGASTIIRGIPFIFVAKRFPPRMLFTLAHELGHLLGHHDQASLTVDGLRRVGGMIVPKDPRERFADQFAGHLLLPSESLVASMRVIKRVFGIREATVGDIEILYVARFFGVSFEVAARRCEDEGLLPKGSGYSLYQAIKEKHVSPEKRAAELGLPERPEIDFPEFPVVLGRAVIECVQEGLLSIGRAAEFLHSTVDRVMGARGQFA